MQHSKPQQLHCNQNGRSLAGWYTSRPHPRARVYHTDVKATATARDPVSAVDLIQWPEGTRPKRGGVTKHSLTRLKVAELRAELQRLGAEPVGTKEQLAEQLLQLICGETSPSQAASNTAEPAANPSVEQAHHTQQLQLGPASSVEAAGTQQDSQSAEVEQASTAAHAAAEHEVVQTTFKQLHLNGSSKQATRSPSDQQPHQPVVPQQQAVQTQVNHTQGSAAAQQHPQPQQQQQQQQQLPPALDQIVQAGRVVPVDAAEAARVAAAVGVDLAAIPPLVEKSRGQVYDVEGMTTLTPYQHETVLKANRSGLSLTLLGGAYSSAAETGDAGSPCLALLREKDIWLFDVGEDVQRAVIWREHIKPSKLHRIVITRQSPESLLGLPGILCVIGSSREKGHEFADIPVQVFAPEGTADLLSTLYECSNTFLEMPVIIYEFVTRAVSDAEQRPHAINRRAKLFRALMPPDQLNHQGYTQAAIDGFLPLQGRATVRRGIRSSAGVLAVNPRAGHRPFLLPQPGDPTLPGLRHAEMTWTVVVDESAMMTAVMCEADTPTWGLVWREADKQGNLNVTRCNAFKITNGSLYSAIKNGESVPNQDGVMVPAGLLCSVDRPGRKVVLLPPCSRADSLAQHAADADVMVGDAAAAVSVGMQQIGKPQQQQQQQQQQHVLGMGLGVCAQEWGVRHLVVTGMPGCPDSSINNKWKNAGLNERNRINSSSRDDSSSEGSTDSGDDEQAVAVVEADQQQQQQPDPAVSALLGVIAEQYTAGAIIPARDDLSLIVEENAGHLSAPPVDWAEKTAIAWTTALNGLIEPASASSSAASQGKMNQRQQATGSRTADKSRSSHQQNRQSMNGAGPGQDRQPGKQQQQQWNRQGRQQQQSEQGFRREGSSSSGRNGFQQQQRGRQRDGRLQEQQRDRR